MLLVVLLVVLLVQKGLGGAARVVIQVVSATIAAATPSLVLQHSTRGGRRSGKEGTRGRGVIGSGGCPLPSMPRVGGGGVGTHKGSRGGVVVGVRGEALLLRRAGRKGGGGRKSRATNGASGATAAAAQYAPTVHGHG